MRFTDLGLVGYDEGLAFQRSAHERVSGGGEAEFILCSHRPVITLGRHTPRSDVKTGEDALARAGIALRRADRGGQATYHGPGQQMVYAVCDLRRSGRDLHRFLRALESVVIGALEDLGVRAVSRPGLTGAWTGERKISSIGIGVRGWVSYHGIALNVDSDDLSRFLLLRPCGMDIEMTCAEKELGRPVDRYELKETIKRRIQHDQSRLAGTG
ncbi:MAG: lipoyl(octanoyl) transferase LipB [Deltaproteobacteria bacterium]